MCEEVHGGNGRRAGHRCVAEPVELHVTDVAVHDLELLELEVLPPAAFKSSLVRGVRIIYAGRGLRNGLVAHEAYSEVAVTAHLHHIRGQLVREVLNGRKLVVLAALELAPHQLLHLLRDVRKDVGLIEYPADGIHGRSLELSVRGHGVVLPGDDPALGEARRGRHKHEQRQER
ncbi:MAG: hypothetical protein U9O18_01790 [Chloroflexota bacterium]|nr:hypothetical protein [Chloroflexota bacterium]